MVQAVDQYIEALPLSESSKDAWLVGVCLVDEPKVDCSLPLRQFMVEILGEYGHTKSNVVGTVVVRSCKKYPPTVV